MSSGNVQTSDPIVGKFNPNGRGTDFSQFSSQGQKLTGLRICWNSDAITSLDFAFNGNPGGEVRGSLHKDNLQSEIFNLIEGDAIIEVYGRFSNVLNCLAIKTAKGQSKVWGNPILGEKFVFKGPNSYIQALKVRALELVDYLEPVYGDATYLFAKAWPFASNNKFTENVGFSQGGSEEFNDWDWLNDKFNYRVAKCTLWGNKDFVTGVQLHYEIDGTLKSPGMHLCDNDDDKKTFISLENDEILERVQAKVTPSGVTYLSLITNKGRSVESGNRGSNGDTYIAKVPENKQIVTFKGEQKNVLCSFGFYYDEWY